MSKKIISSLISVAIVSVAIGAYAAKQAMPTKVLAQKPVEQIGQDLKDSQKILDHKLDVDAIVKRRNEIDKELAEIRAENRAILERASKDREALIEARKINQNLTKISASIDKTRQEDLTRRINAYNAETIEFIQKIERKNRDLEQALSVPMTSEMEPTTDLVNGNSREAINYRQRRVQESLNAPVPSVVPLTKPSTDSYENLPPDRD